MGNIAGSFGAVKEQDGEHKYPFPFRLGDPTARLSLAYAREQGYGVTLVKDGQAIIRHPKGHTYLIADLQCSCRDHLFNHGGTYGGHCKHLWWVSQLYPCECSGEMELAAMRLSGGKKRILFKCRICKNTVPFGLVRAKRRVDR